ncbi:MAG: TIGR00375 family protein [Firmicutes bacterium]|nr:TIGR00375 family protein [Bacillota bacterium]
MNEYFADLHIHLGRDGRGRPVKISASAGLTVTGVVEECTRRKGIQIAGVVDCHSPGVLDDLRRLVAGEDACEDAAGGIRVAGVDGCYSGAGATGADNVTVILCSEVEVVVRGARCHLLAYLPTLESMVRFSRWLEPRVTNVTLSSQRCEAPAGEVVRVAADLGGLVAPAHVFTPHRGILGACVTRLGEAFDDRDLEHMPSVELGLSADTGMADTIDEMSRFSFLSNSDAHSRASIAREYNTLWLEAPSFAELLLALRYSGGRRVTANYGLDPRLGKYHRTFCPVCGHVATGPAPENECTLCGNARVVLGVWDRVRSIASSYSPVHPHGRPQYMHQVPLAFIPGLGPRSLDRIIAAFGSEMNALHRASAEDLESVVGPILASRVVAAREGRLQVTVGAGGVYGSVCDPTG